MRRLLGFTFILLLFFSCAGPSRRAELTMPYEDRLQLAAIYVQSSQADRALPLLEEAVLQEPDRPEAHGMLGEILFLKEDFKGSEDHLIRALEVGGDDPLVLNNLAWVMLKQGHADKALAFIERALSLYPVTVYPYLDTRARTFQALGRNTEALTDARRALSLVPEHDTRMREQLEVLIREIEESDYGPEEEDY